MKGMATMGDRAVLNTLMALGLLLWFGGAAAEVFRNHVGMSFADIPAGRFEMGSSEKLFEMGLVRADELPQHTVVIPRPFQIGRYEVTVKMFRKFIDAKGRDDLLTSAFLKYNRHGKYHPVVYVSYQDALDFIDWMNESKPFSDKGVYRLPTEAEWEYAARAGSDTLYWYGSKASQLERYAWYVVNTQSRPVMVGEKPANPWGLFDVHGNVWEWTGDWYDRDYYKNSPAQDPKGPESGRKKVIRGGSWYSVSDFCRSAFREGNTPNVREPGIGFRVVRDLSSDSADNAETGAGEAR